MDKLGGSDLDLDFSDIEEIAGDSQKSRSIPSKKQALHLLRKLGVDRNIIKHQLAVLREARDLAYNISKDKINIKLVIAGALLHDIGRAFSHDFNHAVIGADYLRNQGYPEELARVVETHVMAGLTVRDAEKFNLPPRSYIPETLEEKIVCLADKYVIGNEKVSLRNRFQRWMERHGETEFLKDQFLRAQKLEEEILKLIF